MQSMIFAIDEINQNHNLLPNISLGYHIFDSCVHLSEVLSGTWQTLSGEDHSVPNYQCQPRVPLAVIGDAFSTTSMAMATLLGVYKYPQVSYTASAPSLSNRFLYPSFFRTIPSDNTQALALAKLVSFMGWNWVGLLSLDDDYGILGSQILKEELQKLGVCLAYHEVFGKGTSPEKMKSIVDIVRQSTAKVVIIFSRDPFINMLLELLENKDPGKIWVACNGWSNSPIASVTQFSRTMMGTLGFSLHEAEITGFKDFLLSIRPSTTLPNDIFVQTFWEIVHSCRWNDAQNGSVLCTGEEKLERFTGKDYEFDEFDFRSHYTIYNAVYAVAYALHAYLSACGKKCRDFRTIKPWRVLHYLKDVHFENKMGDEIYFDQNGDPPTDYDLVNWRRTSDGSIKFVKVGRYNMRETEANELSINISAIQWITGDEEIPRSMCSESCSPGFRKAPQKGRPSCCFDCIPCSEGEISNQTDSRNCFACSAETWPNENKTRCAPKLIEYLSFWEPLGMALFLAVIFASLSTVTILCVFYKNKDTAIVKANNRDLTYVLLSSLSLSFLCPLLFIGEPHRLTCIFRQVAFGVIFVLSVSSVLAKTIMVVVAFSATKPGSNMRMWLGPRVPASTVSICTLLQIFICSYWVLTCPPFPERNMNIKVGVIILQCNECSDTLLWCMLGYMAFLACVSFMVAFLARKLPDSFNEAKWITFSMLIFLSVWISFIPAYLSTQGKYMVAVEIFGITSSGAGVLSCIFLPKTYIILFRPDLNTRENLLGKGSTMRTNM
ncbi:extracellular calcium-sensing receptor-like [Spea bombifrons]|uniref:extracellular calcium-sensing receptor-like n=1 Tax=Spea bombifrons TaxID=233779 RepID=UPI00234AF138|nr:extracellular calcium-sensing receptor-like [Spea bombifrons]